MSEPLCDTCGDSGEITDAAGYPALCPDCAETPRRDTRCACGLTRRQHETGWPACRGFREVVESET